MRRMWMVVVMALLSAQAAMADSGEEAVKYCNTKAGEFVMAATLARSGKSPSDIARLYPEVVSMYGAALKTLSDERVRDFGFGYCLGVWDTVSASRKGDGRGQ